VLTSNEKGNIAEAEVAAAAIRCGAGVLSPVTEHLRYDLAFDVGERLLRVQCKWARLERDVVIVNLTGHRFTTSGAVRTKYTPGEIDAVAAYCDGLDRCYLLPIELVAGMSAIQLRLREPRNGQRACLHWAAEYELPGAIAQLGERLRGTQEAAGSSPASSTIPSPAEVGANEFRNRFGWYMERAAAGERFSVTRRGRPYVRLGPSVEPLPFAGLDDSRDAQAAPQRRTSVGRVTAR
jgi:prevent-host-death family protein